MGNNWFGDIHADCLSRWCPMGDERHRSGMGCCVSACYGADVLQSLSEDWHATEGVRFCPHASTKRVSFYGSRDSTCAFGTTRWISSAFLRVVISCHWCVVVCRCTSYMSSTASYPHYARY